jgi:AraC family transcriptional regulator
MGKSERPIEPCPKCGRPAPLAGVETNKFPQIMCRSCGEQVVLGLLTRTVDCEETKEEDFSRFHVREGAIGAFYLTETRHPAGYRIPKHSHEMASLYFLLAGSLTEQFRRENVERRTDELVFTPADLPHSDVFLGRGGRCLIIELHPALLARLSDCHTLPTTMRSFRGQAAWLSRRLSDEFCFSDGSPLVAEGLLLEILGEICREGARLPSSQSQTKINQAREFIEGAFSQPISLNDVARVVGLHPVHVARMFRQTHRCSVGEYLRRRRVDYARSQLSELDKPLSEIASEAGFCDQAHFTRTFHKLTGLSPSQYRARHRK